MNEHLESVAESGGGKLYKTKPYGTNGFLIPVLAGSHREMGAQYGALLKDPMERAFDVVMKPSFDAGLRPHQELAKRVVSRTGTPG